ncbi:hypothetical protein [Runella slithyformis]|uniref:Uncharacterized protein n=1 Tax=Runella slithyformis (strain ATCC 29530 / DSM 19594 / LMG 11500 / NCIMB 11436 / LSU 4) TaxID=761193 RepID=A0A7U3ZJM7_RUNSL|nr:hypothetical protein [Runella slithyformis]AEI48452.1 hypothetical protein Runsl_2036 [Runella slithyformis DSM 19594]
MSNSFNSAVVAFVAVAVIFGCKDVSDKGIVPHQAVQTAADSSAVVTVHSPSRLGAALYVGYACTPKVNTGTASSKVTLKTSCATFNAGLIAKVTSLSGSIAKITVSLADGKTLGKDGTARLKLTNVCGTEVGNVAFKHESSRILG